MRIHRNYLVEVAKMQALRVLAADDGEDEEDEDEERRHDDQEEEDEEEDEGTVWTSPQRRCP